LRVETKHTTTLALEADWLGACRSATAGLDEMLSGHPTTPDRSAETGRGAGGDDTLVIDTRAEALMFAELARLHEQGFDFTAVSEERGQVRYGDGSSGVRVVIDPIDGSLNAKRLIPSYCLSVAVSAGETMEDVEFAYVHDFGNGEEYVARLGEGATLNGQVLDIEQDRRALEVVGMESARPEWIAPVAAKLEGRVYRIRILGSIALSLCWLAAGRFDGMLTANTCRSCDAAAGQLIAREAGAFVSVLGHGGLEAPLDLDTRFRLAGAHAPESLETLVKALTAAGLPQ
jgi:myo-inositol-1(or 4)-monophosphatase